MENNDKQIELKFQRFFTVNFPKVKNFAQMLLKSESDAEDVAQVMFSVSSGCSLSCGWIMIKN